MPSLPANRRLGDRDQPWVTFTDWTNPTYASFPTYYRDALREIRYSFGDCALDKRFPFTPWTDLAFPPAGDGARLWAGLESLKRFSLHEHRGRQRRQWDRLFALLLRMVRAYAARALGRRYAEGEGELAPPLSEVVATTKESSPLSGRRLSVLPAK